MNSREIGCLRYKAGHYVDKWDAAGMGIQFRVVPRVYLVSMLVHRGEVFYFQFMSNINEWKISLWRISQIFLRKFSNVREKIWKQLRQGEIDSN